MFLYIRLDKIYFIAFKDTLLSGLGDLFPIEFKSNLTVSMVLNTGETGGI